MLTIKRPYTFVLAPLVQNAKYKQINKHMFHPIIFYMYSKMREHSKETKYKQVKNNKYPTMKPK